MCQKSASDSRDDRIHGIASTIFCRSDFTKRLYPIFRVLLCRFNVDISREGAPRTRNEALVCHLQA
jgi:hypothetical protein